MTALTDVYLTFLSAGNEGAGLSPEVLSLCDVLLTIPSGGATSAASVAGVASLNVGNATGESVAP